MLTVLQTGASLQKQGRQNPPSWEARDQGWSCSRDLPNQFTGASRIPALPLLGGGVGPGKKGSQDWRAVPVTLVPVASSVLVKVTVSRAWERELRSFMLVEDVTRFRFPSESI